MKLASWNVNGIRSVVAKGELQAFIKAHRPDVLCLQETKAERGQAEIDLSGYEEYWHSSARKKGYAGTAVFVKKGLEARSVRLGLPGDICKKYKLEDSFGDANAEGRVIAVELGPPAGGFWVVNVYTPNAKPDLSRLVFRHKRWDPAFLEYVSDLDKEKPVLFCGDLNVAHKEQDLANPIQNIGEHGFTYEEREGIDNMLKAGFIDTFRHFTSEGNGHYTWWSHFAKARERNVGWRIDYWFASKKLLPRLTSAKILPEVKGSDHCPVVLELK